MKITALSLVCAAAILAGCGGTPDPVAVACKPRDVKVANANQHFVSTLEEERTPATVLLKKKGVVRKATLDKPGENPLRVLFFQTGVTGCPWLAANDASTPVVIKDGFIYRVGNQRLRDLTDDGWTLREAAWPWQDYNFGYLPAK